MQKQHDRVAIAAIWGLAFLAGLLAAPEARAVVIKTLDRKFPIGKYCPLESRAAAGVDLSFVAPAASVRITFSADNQDASGNHSNFHIDNVVVVDKLVFDSHLVSSIPGFDDCYNPSTPPGQTSGGILNAPSFDFNAAGTAEKLLDLFPSNVSGWTGAHVYFDAASTAPTNPATGTGTTGGSLGLGLSTDGAITVSASKVVTGLTAGAQYDVFVWWRTLATKPLTIRIDVPCPDLDGDGFVLCGSCDLAAGQTCGDCDDTKPHCTTSCVDSDGDGWCGSNDCNDGAATCTSDCATDSDADLIADCRDTCIDADRDGYGSAGGGGNSCLGADCNSSNEFCNVSCVDGDGDGHCAPGDCQDANFNVGNRLPEINDWTDQNCPGDADFGIIDEISGNSGFLTAGNKNLYSWPFQAGGLSYLAVRSSSPTFLAGCTSSTTSSNGWTDAANPASGGVFYYLVRALTTAKGSWGEKTGGVERAVICGAEANCGNGADDDGDAAIDCADSDCAATAACHVQTFAFTDSTGNDIADNALNTFFQSATAGANDYIFFQIVEGPTRTVAWCSQNAGFYRTQYLALASTFGTATSGSWNKWRKAPSTSNNWSAVDTTGHTNTYGDNCFGLYSWCSEQFSPEPQNSIFPNRINDCEAYDLSTGACGASIGGTWQLTLKIAPTRVLACGF